MNFPAKDTRTQAYVGRIRLAVIIIVFLPLSSSFAKKAHALPELNDENKTHPSPGDAETSSPKSSGQLPKLASRPDAPSPPAASFRGRVATYYPPIAPPQNAVIPEHMKDFHSRVMSYLHSFSETKNMIEKSSEYMLNLYRHQQSLTSAGNRQKTKVKRKQQSALKRSDLVRSFEAVDSYMQSNSWIIVFDLSAIRPQESIRLSEIQLHVPSRFDGVVSINVYDEQKTVAQEGFRLERRKIGTLSLIAQLKPKNEKVTIEATRVIRRWYNKQNEHEQDNEVAFGHRNASAEHYSQQNYGTISAEKTSPMLFVYSANKQLDLMDTALHHFNRHRRSSRRHINQKHRHLHGIRTGKRKHWKAKKKKNRTEKISHGKVVSYSEHEHRNYADESFGNEIEYFPHSKTFSRNQEETEEFDSWANEQKQEPVDKNSNDKLSPVTVQPPHFPFPTFSEPLHCRRVPFELNFANLGWDKWIIKPVRFNAYRCEGSCSNPRYAESRPTNHAFMQGLLSQLDGSTVPEPCCVPVKFRPLSMLYFESGVVRHRLHENMVVTECGCR